MLPHAGSLLVAQWRVEGGNTFSYWVGPIKLGALTRFAEEVRKILPGAGFVILIRLSFGLGLAGIPGLLAGLGGAPLFCQLSPKLKAVSTHSKQQRAQNYGVFPVGAQSLRLRDDFNTLRRKLHDRAYGASAGNSKPPNFDAFRGVQGRSGQVAGNSFKVRGRFHRNDKCWDPCSGWCGKTPCKNCPTATRTSHWKVQERQIRYGSHDQYKHGREHGRDEPERQ